MTRWVEVVARLPVIVGLAGVAGCDCCDYPEQEDEVEADDPPSITWASGDGFPPVGRDGAVVVHVVDDRGLSYLGYGFRSVGQVSLYGREAEVELSGDLLGEGIGPLDLQVVDSGGLWSGYWLERVVVDLSPPRIEIGDTIQASHDTGLYFVTGVGGIYHDEAEKV